MIRTILVVRVPTIALFFLPSGWSWATMAKNPPFVFVVVVAISPQTWAQLAKIRRYSRENGEQQVVFCYRL
jgi:hypothetical protein